MTTLTARPAADEVHLLGEGPVWDHARARLLWVDIEAGDVLTGTIAGTPTHTRVVTTSRVHVDRTVGAVVPTADGDLLVAGREVLHLLAADGTTREVARILPPDCGRRLNDGACDPAGRFLVGSLAVGTPAGASRTQTLHRLEDDGTLLTLDDDLTLSNGLAWSPDGRVLYSADTLAGVVRARDYDPRTGGTGPWRAALHLAAGWPDGLRVDADGNLWIAVWGAAQVRCHRPDGALLHVVDVPVPHPSAVAFAGPDLTMLVITTASAALSPAERAEHPAAGRLFTVDLALLGVRGLPTTPWRPVPPTPNPSTSMEA